jgi:acyl-CoA dehydrogenase
MGALGFFGIRYPSEYGGSEMDTLATVVLAEELGRSTFSGAAITALVHTDMASVHIFNGGSPAQRDRFMPGYHRRRKDRRRRRHRARCRLRREGYPHHGAARGRFSYVLNGAKMFITNGVHADLYCVAAKTDLLRRSRRNRSRSSWSRRARRASRSRARSTSMAGARPTLPNWSSRIAASQPRTCSARRGAASTRS